MARRGHLFIVSGPSGAGKGTLVRELVKRDPSVWVSVSVTTRAPRPGEVEGRHYFFISADEFSELHQDAGLIEWAEVHGNCYGTPRRAVEAKIADGAQVVLEIDPQGAFQVRDLMPDAILVFIMPPSTDELKRRLARRGSETDEQVAVRMKTAERELALVGKYDHVVINDDVSRAADELAHIVRSYSEES